MKIIILGSSNFTLQCLLGFIKSGIEIIEIISTTKNLLPDNSEDMHFHSSKLGINYYEIDDINSINSKNHLRSLTPDLIFSSWHKIIDLEVLNIPKLGVIGSHPTNLPFNKGRHPLHWLIFLNINESKLSFFWMDSGVDSGNIIYQLPFDIDSNDDIHSLSEKINQLAFIGCEKIGKDLKNNLLSSGEVQNQNLSNTWRKRDRFDLLIDLRMNSESILNLVKSFTIPFSCARLVVNDLILHVLSAEKFDFQSDIPLIYYEPGFIISKGSNFIIVKCYDCFIKIYFQEDVHDYFNLLKYVYSPAKYIFLHPILKEKIFL